VPQLNYFSWVAGQMAPNDQVILCNAEPYWTIREKYGRMRPELLHSNLDVLIDTTFARQRVRVLLSGDSHHYQRHLRPDDGQQRIIAGGGGAFMHLTNGPKLDKLDGGHEGVLQTTWPTRDESNRLCLRNLAFPVLNPHFGDVTGLVYLLIAWTLGTSLLLSQLLQSGGPLFRNATGLGPTFFWGLLIVLTFVLFTDTHAKTFRVIAGTLHGLAHYLALLLLMQAGAFVARSVIPEQWYGLATLRFLVFSAVVFAGAWLAGGLLMGLYLWISLRWLGRHQNEASSSLHIPDWKNFLRLIIDPSGKLTIHAIGIRRVPRRWTNNSPPVSADARATQPELIESITL
jgi:hypothetical protein